MIIQNSIYIIDPSTLLPIPDGKAVEVRWIKNTVADKMTEYNHKMDIHKVICCIQFHKERVVSHMGPVPLLLCSLMSSKMVSLYYRTSNYSFQFLLFTAKTNKNQIIRVFSVYQWICRFTSFFFLPAFPIAKMSLLGVE